MLTIGSLLPDQSHPWHWRLSYQPTPWPFDTTAQGNWPQTMDFALVRILIAHLISFPKLLIAFMIWALQHQITLMLNIIQEEQTQDIGWLMLYSTKHTNCQELGVTILAVLQTPATLQVKQINAGKPKGTKAHTVHVIIGITQAITATAKLEAIYGENSLNNKSTQYPLGQRLLLGPLATTLNATNLGQLNLLLKWQASFCHKLVTIATQDIAHVNHKFKMTMDKQKTLGHSRKN